MKRQYTHRAVCAHEGCSERANWFYERQYEMRDHIKRLNVRPWRCTRHTKPDDVLSAENSVRTATLKSYEETYGKFWRTEEGASQSGFQYGPGFKAFAEDFPPGTRLIVTAEVVLPA